MVSRVLPQYHTPPLVSRILPMVLYHTPPMHCLHENIAHHLILMPHSFQVVDDGVMLEIQGTYARNIIIGFAVREGGG